MNEQVSSNRLFVWGLAWKLRGKDLRETFSQFGEVTFAKVVFDRETRRSRGFGFVEFENPEDAANAKQEMDGAELEGRNIKVDFAINKLDKEEGESQDDEEAENEEETTEQEETESENEEQDEEEESKKAEDVFND